MKIRYCPNGKHFWTWDNSLVPTETAGSIPEHPCPVHRSTADEIFIALEGVCPNCGSKTKITYFGGTENFVDNYELGIKPVIWKGGDTIGAFEFTCQECGNKFYTEQNRWGDWSA